jgi:hypothetical protein
MKPKRQISDYVEATVTRLNRQREAILKEAIDRAIGESWDISDIAGRCSSVTIHGSSDTTYYLDGKAIVCIKDPDYGTVVSSRLIKPELSYEFLTGE